MIKNELPILLSRSPEHPLMPSLLSHSAFEPGNLLQHHFPDQETLIDILTPIKNRQVWLLESFDQVNHKILPALFIAKTAKMLGASSISIIAPYLAYMRQDIQFSPGQGISSVYFAELLSGYFDRLITVDPHLHRWHSLDQIFTIPTAVAHATESIAQWINNHVVNPLLIGPDSESNQWVEALATMTQLPFVVLEKIRKSDHDVHVSMPDIHRYRDATPVLVDDIISTGMTLLDTIHHLENLHLKPPVCIGIHAVFAENAYQKLLNSRIEGLVTCNTIAHPSNTIDVSHSIITTIQSLL